MQDAKIMVNELVKKTVNDTINMWKSLKISSRTKQRRYKTNFAAKNETYKAVAQELYEHR